MPAAIASRLLRPLAVIALAPILSCATNSSSGGLLHSDGETIWLGPITKTQLHRHFPDFADNQKTYALDASAVQKIESKLDGEEFLLFLGTWCVDSVSEVPKFLALYEDLEGPRPNLQLHAVDRAKRDRSGLAESHAIEFVPTLIVQRDGHEIGRIVELPERSMEEDLLSILNEPTTR